jgi:hypothetical protein
MAIRKSSNSGIPFGNTAGRPTAATGQPYFNGETGRLELYTSTGWQNIVQETPGIASASGTYNESAGSGTFAVSGTNFVSGAIAYAVGTNAVEYQATTTTYDSIVQLTVVFSNLSPAYEPYDIKVTNPSNLFGLLPDAFYINDSPVWATSSGSLGTWDGSSIQLSATDDESNTITYTVTSGSLPTGLTLSSAGLISGTTTENAGTYTFTVGASDGVNTAVTRSFSIIVPAFITGGTLTSDSTYYYRTFTGSGSLTTNLSLLVDYLLVAGGAGGGGRHSGGGGGGQVTYNSSYSLNTGSHTVTIGSGGAGPYGDNPGGAGEDSFFLETAKGGGKPGSYGGGAAQVGGSGGGGGYSSTSGAGSNKTTSSIGASTYGNAGGNTSNWGAGGGGAGAAGGSGDAGVGGAGIANSILGTTYYWGGGGGGSMWENGPGGAGGIGGGGGGGSGGGGASNSSGGGSALNSGESGGGTNSYNGPGTTKGGDGGANTGGGGGGCGQSNHGSYTNSSINKGGNGGSGILVVRYTRASVGG